MLFLWIKALHVFFIVAWFAGLFYLPRLFVYHTEVSAGPEHERFVIMERRLYGMTLFGMLGAWVFGLWTLSFVPGYLHMGWLHAKLTLVLLLSGYTGFLKASLRKFAAGTNTKSAKTWKIINEVPAIGLLLVLILVIVKPF